MLQTTAPVPHQRRIWKRAMNIVWAGLAFLGACENEYQAFFTVHVISEGAIARGVMAW
jgi:hypothetical protein